MDRRLIALVRHAGRNVPFYRRLYQDAGIDLSAFRGVEDIEKLPIVSRQQMQECPLEDRVALGRQPDALVVRATSGSSGMPLRILRTKSEDLLLQAVRLRARHSHGLRPWERTARLDLIKRVKTGGAQPLTAVAGRRGLFPFRQFDAFGDAGTLAGAIATYRPALLVGQPSFLERLCTQAETSALAQVRPKLVGTGGETLLPATRTLIENTFQAPVVDYYGSHEFNLIGWQREPGASYDIARLITAAEVVAEGAPERPAGPGEHGELVGTALCSWASPFIRYRLGDEVTVHRLDEATGLCASIRNVRGRVTDYFVGRAGDILHIFKAIGPLLQAAPWLRSFRIHQQRPGELLITLTASQTAGSEAVDRAQAQLGELFRDSVQIQLQIADHIPPTRNGKSPLFVRDFPLPGPGLGGTKAE
jgi:phenylacetate-CoA ligase